LRFTRFYSGESSYGLTYSGVSYAWGLNSSGQLGLGDVASRSSPVAILGGLKFSNIFKGTVGEQIAFGLERDTGILYAWGANSNGQLGVGNIASRSSPVAVLGGLKFRKVAVGSGCAVGLDHTGVAYAWGLNSSGELGLGDLIPRSSPVAVLGGLVFRDVHVIPNSSNSFYGITEYGDLYAWGGNINGQLGIGSTADKSSPTLIVGGLRFEKLAKLCSGNSSVVAIQKGTGIAYSWGNNGSGELGVGDIVPRSSPVAVLGGLKFSNVILGDTFAYGEASDGRHYAWGVNTDGQLGDGTTVAKSSPVLVQGLTQPYFVAPIIKVVPVVKGSTYKIKVGGGVSFFGDTNIGTNSRSITIAYEI
jgi:alpha-tubulin suppressor-like RCC1 family protein